MSEDRTTGSAEITEGTKVDLKIVVGIGAAIFTLCGSFYGLSTRIDAVRVENDAKIATLSARIDATDERAARQMKVLCSVARKLNVESVECLAP
jgi:hypothetical protein